MRGGIFMVYYFSSEKHDAHIDFSKKLSSFLNSTDAFSHPIAVMCIGSDRSTGDSLGPLIGYKLSKFAFNNVFIYGSLNNPINAVNLEFAITFIKNFHSNPYIIAIDLGISFLFSKSIQTSLNDLKFLSLIYVNIIYHPSFFLKLSQKQAFVNKFCMYNFYICYN